MHLTQLRDPFGGCLKLGHTQGQINLQTQFEKQKKNDDSITKDKRKKDGKGKHILPDSQIV